MASVSLGQVEDELREAEAYLFQDTPTDKASATATMTEARRKEILSKLNAERAALRQRKADGAMSTADDSPAAASSFLDSTAFFPLPSHGASHFSSPFAPDGADDDALAMHSRQDSDGDHSAFGGDDGDDDDESMYFLKELQRTDGSDSLFFASDIHQLPQPSFDRHSAANEIDCDESDHLAMTPRHGSNTEPSPCPPPKRGVRFDIDLHSPARPVAAPQPPPRVSPPNSIKSPAQTKVAKTPSFTKSSAEFSRSASSSPPIAQSKTVAPSSTSRRTSSGSLSAQQKRMDQLARAVDYTAREKIKVAQDMATLTSTCSFQPAANARLPRGNQSLKTPEKAPKGAKAAQGKPPPAWSPHKKAKVDELTERLHVEGALRFELREKVKQVLDDQHVRATCTFKPQINRNNRSGSAPGHKPIHARLPELQRQKKEMLRQLEHAIEAESQLTFAPTINAHSQKLANELSKMDVTDRLVQDAEDSAEKKLQVQAYYAALDEPAFVPCVNNRSQAIVERKPEFKLDFVARQQLLHAQMEQKFEAKLALEERVQAEEKPFHPCIGNSDQVLKYTRPKRLVESKQAQLYRMTYEEPRQRELAKKRLEDEQYDRFPHKPTLNTVSKALGQPTSIHKLAQKPSTKKIRSRVVRAMDAQEQAECRFRPDLVAADPDVDRTSVWNPDTCLQQIEQARAMRRQKLEDQRNSLEFQELQACTFAPAINPPTTKPSRAPVIVRGLGRFLELKQLAKRQEAELKEREAKAFTQTRDYTPRAYTVPQPFNLSYDQRRRARQEQLKAEMDAKELGECTFQPQTMEHRNRRLIQSLLDRSNEME